MSYFQGRLIDHIHLRVADFERSRKFYKAILEALGRGDSCGGDGHAFWADELYIDAVEKGGTPSRLHLAFQARDHEAVKAFHEAGLAAGGRDNGAPGYRDYHEQYYAAFLLDPDGSNIEAVCDAPVRRSVDAVEVERLGRNG